MKQLSKACCICLLALSAVACNAVSGIDSGLRRLDLGADTYIVRAGDTLSSIAFRYDMSDRELSALNPGRSEHLRVGTALNVQPQVTREAIRSTGDTAWRDNARQPATTRGRASSEVVTQPAYRPRAVPSRELPAAENPTVYAPSVAAVASDIALLSPTPLPSGELSQDLTMRNGVLEPINYARQEIVEEEYVHGKSPVTRAAMDAELESYIGRWEWPTRGQVARGFAPDTEGRHGVDIAGVPGQQVVAVMDGTVAYSGKDPSGAGNLIIVRHDDDLLTAYSHTRDLYVAEDDTVRAGDPIATLGANSRQESVLRFEVRQNGNSLNPMDFLAVP